MSLPLVLMQTFSCHFLLSPASATQQSIKTPSIVSNGPSSNKQLRTGAMDSASEVQINSIWSSAMQSSKGLDLLSSAYVRRNTLYIHFPYTCHASIRRLEV